MRLARFFAVVLTCAITAGGLHRADAADTPAANANPIDSRTACATQFSATKVDGDPDAVVARALNLAGLFSGTITAYGADRTWTAVLDRAALVTLPYGGREASVLVRADAPIEGIEYAPAWAPCRFHAGSAPRSGYEARDVERPVLSVGNPQPMERATCEHPYASPKMTRAFEPNTPALLQGLVSVAVALDERGVPQFARVVSSADAGVEPISYRRRQAKPVLWRGFSLSASTERLRIHNRLQPVISRRTGYRILALAAMWLNVAGVNASAQTPAPSASVTPAPSGALRYCPLSTSVRDVDDTHTRYAVTLRAFKTGRGSGTVALWAGDRRYDVPFRDLVALDSRDLITPEIPLVVRFAAPTVLDGAVVTAIGEGGSQRPCDPWFAPWVPVTGSGPDFRTHEERSTEERFIARARAAVAVDAPTAVADPISCTTPNRRARTTYAVEPERPQFAETGFVMVMVLLDPTDHIVGVRVERSSGDRRLDDATQRAASGSQFQGEVFRCRHVVGGYLFGVEFGP